MNLLQMIDDELAGDPYYQGAARVEDGIRVEYDRLTYEVAEVGGKIGAVLRQSNGGAHKTPFAEMLAGRIQLLVAQVGRETKLLGMTPAQARLVGERLFAWAAIESSPPLPEEVDEISRQELAKLIIRAMPGNLLSPPALDYREDWDGYAFTWRGKFLIVRRDLVVMHAIDSGLSSETPLGDLVRALLRREAKRPEIAQRPPHSNHVWRAIEASIEPGDIRARETVGVFSKDGRFTGEVRFTWCGQRFRVDHELKVRRDTSAEAVTGVCYPDMTPSLEHALSNYRENSHG